MKAKESISSHLSGRDGLLLCLHCIQLNMASALSTSFTVSQRTGVGETTHSKVMKCSQAINICLAFIISPEDYI